jgi:uncharacterized membrane protein YphA (DoxX/SURF4 family)
MASRKSIGHYLTVIARILFGLVFLVAGLNGFLNFIPQPKTPLPPGAFAFATAMKDSHYFIQLLAGTQLLVGVLLLINLFVPLALVIIAPVIVNIVAFHVFLAPQGLGVALVVVVLELFLVWSCRKSYRPLFVMKAVPG